MSNKKKIGKETKKLLKDIEKWNSLSKDHLDEELSAQLATHGEAMRMLGLLDEVHIDVPEQIKMSGATLDDIQFTFYGKLNAALLGAFCTALVHKLILLSEVDVDIKKTGDLLRGEVSFQFKSHPGMNINVFMGAMLQLLECYRQYAVTFLAKINATEDALKKS